MKLLIKRSQRAGGIFGGKVFFVLDIRVEYTPEERESINKYSLGGEVIYNSEASKKYLDAAEGSGIVKGIGLIALARMKLNITIASLQKGHHIECKDLAELTAAEVAVHDACVNVRKHLEVASTFDGREILIDVEEPTPAAICKYAQLSA